MAPLYLLVGVDLEGADGSVTAGQARPAAVPPPRLSLAALHARLVAQRVRPTYFVSLSALAGESAPAMLETVRGGGCEIGALHASREHVSTDDAGGEPAVDVRCRLDRLDRELVMLASAVEQVAGERPTSYRWLGPACLAARASSLERVGCDVDSSIVIDTAPRPYFLSYDEPHRPGTSNVLEVPSFEKTAVPWGLRPLVARAGRLPLLSGVVHPLLGARAQSLDPARSSLDSMKQLSLGFARAGLDCLNVRLRFEEMAAGGPYNRDDAAVRGAAVERLDAFLSFASSELNAIPVTFREFRARLLNG